MSMKDEWLIPTVIYVNHLPNRGPTSQTCADWGIEAPVNSDRPTQKCYPVRHGIGCRGHREFMPSILDLPYYSSYRYNDWLRVKEEYL